MHNLLAWRYSMLFCSYDVKMHRVNTPITLIGQTLCKGIHSSISHAFVCLICFHLTNFCKLQSEVQVNLVFIRKIKDGSVVLHFLRNRSPCSPIFFWFVGDQSETAWDIWNRLKPHLERMEVILKLRFRTSKGLQLNCMTSSFCQFIMFSHEHVHSGFRIRHC